MFRAQRKQSRVHGSLVVRDGVLVGLNRPNIRRVARVARGGLGLALLLVLPGGALNQAPRSYGPPPPIVVKPMVGAYDDVENGNLAEDEKRLQRLNAERQKNLVNDTVRLLKLAHELDSEVNDAAPDSVTMVQVTKVGEIEKLARRVKDNMRTSVRGSVMLPQLNSPMLR